jgi:hypothetical protein
MTAWIGDLDRSKLIWNDPNDVKPIRVAERDGTEKASLPAVKPGQSGGIDGGEGGTRTPDPAIMSRVL